MGTRKRMAGNDGDREMSPVTLAGMCERTGL
jgi:hypothetical protein